MSGWWATPWRFSQIVAVLNATSATDARAMPAPTVGCTPSLPPMTSAVPSSPSASPSQRLAGTRSAETSGMTAATSTGCSDVISATVPAELPTRNALHAAPK